MYHTEITSASICMHTEREEKGGCLNPSTRVLSRVLDITGLSSSKVMAAEPSETKLRFGEFHLGVGLNPNGRDCEQCM